MNPHDLIDPQLQFFTELPGAELDLSTECLPESRKTLLILFQTRDKALSSSTVNVQEVCIASSSGAADVRCLIYRPVATTASPMPAILEIHGGGFVMGKPEQNDSINRRTAEQHGCVIVAVDYRLAPEAPPLGGVEDCYTALQWMHTEAVALGIDVNRIAIRGDSGGGGIAAALALLARDRGGPSIAFQLLIYPMLDHQTGSSVDRGAYAGFVGWSPRQNRAGWRGLLGMEPGGENISYYQSPAHCDDLTGLPATFIGVGALDLFFEEDLEYARRLARAGVPVELHVYAGAPHAFDRFDTVALAGQFNRDVDTALQRIFAK